MFKLMFSLVFMFFSLNLYANNKVYKIVLNEKNTVIMNNYFDEESVTAVLQKVRNLDSDTLTKEPIYLFINSGGGSIQAGIELINNLKAMKRTVHVITIYGASMGFITSQLLGNSYITESGVMMSHKARGGFQGEFPGQLDNRYNMWKNRVLSLEKQVVSRNSKIDLKKYHNMIENEYWCQDVQCVADGFASHVVRPVCDDSLKGTYKEKENHFVGVPLTLEYEFSKCPTQTGIVSFQVYINGKPLWSMEGSIDSTLFLDNETVSKINMFVKDKMKERMSKDSKMEF